MTEPTPADYAAAARQIEYEQSPAGAFERVMQEVFNPEAAAPEGEQPARPSVPAPNAAQGTSALGSVTPPSGEQSFTELLQSALRQTPPH